MLHLKMLYFLGLFATASIASPKGCKTILKFPEMTECDADMEDQSTVAILDRYTVLKTGCVTMCRYAVPMMPPLESNSSLT